MSNPLSIIGYEELHQSIWPAIILDLDWKIVLEIQKLNRRRKKSGPLSVAELTTHPLLSGIVDKEALELFPVDESSEEWLLHFVLNMTLEQFEWIQVVKDLVVPSESAEAGELFIRGFCKRIPSSVMVPVVARALKRVGREGDRLSDRLAVALSWKQLTDETILLMEFKRRHRAEPKPRKSRAKAKAA